MLIRRFALVLLLTICASEPVLPAPPTATAPPAPQQPLTLAEWCRNSMVLLANPYLDSYAKQALLEMMRNRGCLK
jgi:hypothetical protein